jgi:hypothetical protein
VEGSCEHGAGKLLDWLHNWQLLMMGSVPYVSSKKSLLQTYFRSVLTRSIC